MEQKKTNQDRRWVTRFLIIALFLLSFAFAGYGQYCNNPTGVTMTRSGTTATITWTDNSSAHYYWVILKVSPFGSTNWFEVANHTSDWVTQGGTDGATSVYVTGLPSTGTLYAYVAGVNSSWEWCPPDAAATGGEAVAPPEVTTSAATSVALNSATLGGNATSEGGASITDRGVVYSSTDNTPTSGEPGVTTNSHGTTGTGSFSESITGLAMGTTYYFQAYATNTGGTSYGGVLNFTTPSNTPPVANNDTYNRFYTETGVSFTVAASGVLGNDTDGESDPLTVGTPRPASAVTQGSLTLNANGSFTYTSPNSVKDETATFTYYAYDGTVNSSTAATVTINILTPRFVGPGTNFNEPANWNCGYVPTENLNIIIAPNQSIVFNQSYTCKNLQFMAGSSFSCTGGNTLTITGDVYDSAGNIAIDVATGSTLVVTSSIQIQNP